MKIIPANRNRLYVQDPKLWAMNGGTDFLFVPSLVVGHIAATTVNDSMVDYGWAITSPSFASQAGADFITSADIGTPNAWLFNASGDILRSPVIFGDYSHAYQASWVLGYVPTTLNMEAIAAFTTASANETQSAFGFLEDDGTASVAADHMAAIFSDGTNFGLRSGAATDAGALIDTNYHRWRITVSSASVEWFIDGTSQGTIALEADEFPVSFFGHTLTTNRIALGPVRIWYA